MHPKELREKASMWATVKDMHNWRALIHNKIPLNRGTAATPLLFLSWDCNYQLPLLSGGLLPVNFINSSSSRRSLYTLVPKSTMNTNN